MGHSKASENIVKQVDGTPKMTSTIAMALGYSSLFVKKLRERESARDLHVLLLFRIEKEQGRS
jgi:hypothetical protein